jgi:heme exporter protein C
MSAPMIAYLANPERFMRYSRPAAIICAVLAVGLLAWAMYAAFLVVPPERDQGEAGRIVFVHAPSAWLALAGYVALAGASFTYLVWRHSLADAAARAIAPLGAAFAILTFATGWIWGLTSWGDLELRDVADPRLASMLVQVLLYLGYIAMRAAIDDEGQSARAGGILVLVGLVNLPIIKLSADPRFMASLHQPSSTMRAGGPTMDPVFLWTLLASFLGFTFLFAALALVRTRAAVYRRRAEVARRAMERMA